MMIFFSRALTRATLLISSLLIAACGTPGPGGDSPNDSTFPINCEGDSILLEVFATTAITTPSNNASNTLFNPIFNALTPQKALADIRGLTEVNNLSQSAISVVRLDADFNDSSFRDLEYAVEALDSGGYEIVFCERPGSFQPSIDVAVKVQLGDDELFAPLHQTPGQTTAVRVDLNSHFVMTRLFQSIPNDEALAQLVQCPQNRECSNQAQARASLLRSLYISTDSLDLEFSADDTLAAGLLKLGNDIAYTETVDQGINEIVSPAIGDELKEGHFAVGARELFDLEGSIPCIGQSEDYHSSLFRIGVTTVDPEEDNRGFGFTLDSSAPLPENEIGNAVEVYPKLNRRSDYVNSEQNELLSPQLPFRSEQLIVTQNNFRFSSDPFFNFYSGVRGFNGGSQTLSSSDTYITREGELLFDRAVPSFIPFKVDSRSTKGWSHNPTYSKLYSSNNTLPTNNSGETGSLNCARQLNADPTWLTGAYFGTANTYTQSSGDNSFSRQNLKENHDYYSWEVHGLTTDTTFSTSDISGKTYGVIEFAVELDSRAPYITLNANTVEWDASSSNLAQTQPDAHYDSVQITRTSTTATDLTTDGIPNASRGYGLLREETSPDPQDAIISGLISLSGSAPVIGHSSQNGKYLAFVENTDNGKGLILATELRNSTPNFGSSGTTYQLQGNSMEMGGQLNRLRNLKNSTLTINNPTPGSAQDCSARIALVWTSSAVSLDSDLGLPPETGANRIANARTCSIDEGEISLSFTDVLENGQDLTLKGFMTPSDDESDAPGNLINLLWYEEDGLGLVFAQRQLNLNAR